MNDLTSAVKREAVIVLAMHGLFIFGSSVSLTFFHIYFLRLSESFDLNLIYNALMYLFTPVGFLIGGWLAKRYDRLLTFRISLIVFMLFFTCVLTFGERIVQGYGWIALIHGLAQGFYWVGYLVLQYDVSSGLNRMRYVGISAVVLTAANFIGPLAGGQLIGGSPGLTGYLYAFAATILFFLFVFALSFLVSPKPVRLRRLVLGFTPLIARRRPQWTRMLILWFCSGFLEGLLLFIPALLLYDVFAGEGAVSIALAATALVSTASSWVLSRIGRIERSPRYMMLSSFGIGLGALLLSFGSGAVPVAAFLVIVACLNPLYHNTFVSRFFQETERLPLNGSFRVESVVIYESLLNFGRIVPIAALLPFAGSLQSQALWIVLLCAGLAQGTAVWLTFRRRTFAAMTGGLDA
jgi:YQGE family putative transporter